MEANFKVLIHQITVGSNAVAVTEGCAALGLLPSGGIWLEGEEEERGAARTCWQAREREVLTTLTNTAIAAADFETALKVKIKIKTFLYQPLFMDDLQKFQLTIFK